MNASRRRRSTPGFILLLLFALTVIWLRQPNQTLAASPTQLGDLGDYPRVIRLQHSGSANGRLLATGGGGGKIFQSTDDGATWSQIGTAVTTGGCCSTLFEFPQQLGSYAAGTLLYARIPAASGEKVEVFRSTNQGVSWTFHSNCVTGGGGGSGVWEPEFAVDSSGRLLCFFADERQSGYSQVIGHTVSTDGGVTWGNYKIDVGIQDNSTRPGMPIIRKVPGGNYVMAYEICGGSYGCTVYTRTSSDGANWGTASNMGNLVVSNNGKTFKCCPGLAWSPGGGANGRLIVIGRIVLNGSGSGSTIMITSDLTGASGWTEAAAPFTTPNPDSDNIAFHCVNYSSALLPSVDGTRLLMLAGLNTTSGCKTHYATDNLPGSGSPTATATPGGGTLVTVQSVSNGKAYTTGTAQTGALPYIDRSYTLSALDSSLNGQTLVRTANDDDTVTANPHLTLNLSSAAILAVAYRDTATSIPSWLSSWTLTSKTATVSGYNNQPTGYKIYEKSFAAGTATLGGNERGTTGADSNYFVIARPGSGSTPTATPTGSVITVQNSVQGTAQNQFTFSGSWVHGDVSYSPNNTTPNASVEIDFTGTQIKVYGSTWGGIGAISIDGGAETNVDFNGPNALKWTSPTLSNGPHTLRIRAVGANGSSNNRCVVLDYVEITQ
jgi:hypothetical protein